MTGEEKESIDNQPVIDLLLLTWAAGALDALSYLRARVFTANMTGNTVLLGLMVVDPERSRVFHTALALVMFGMGVLLGAVVLLRLRHPDATHDLKAGVSLELPFAAMFTVLWSLFPAGGPGWVIPAMISSAAFALGIQSAAVRRLNIAGVVTTFITGTITTAVVSLAERNQPGVDTPKERRDFTLVLAGMFLVYIVAAMAGAELVSAKSRLAALDPLAALVAVLIRSFLRERSKVRV